MNIYQNSLNERISKFDLTDDKPNRSLTEKITLIKAEILLAEIPTIKKIDTDFNVDDLIALCIYIECKLRGYSPKEALIETEKQMEERKPSTN